MQLKHVLAGMFMMGIVIFGSLGAAHLWERFGDAAGGIGIMGTLWAVGAVFASVLDDPEA